jgi:hypothetical protein
MRTAEIYEKSGRLYVGSCARTTTGLWIGHGSVAVAEANAPEAEIAAIVENAVQNSVSGVPHPVSPKEVSAPLLTAAGARTFGAFARGAKLVRVSEDETGVVVIPTRNGGSTEGFVDLPERRRQLPGLRPLATLGAEVSAALSEAE